MIFTLNRTKPLAINQKGTLFSATLQVDESKELLFLAPFICCAEAIYFIHLLKIAQEWFSGNIRTFFFHSRLCYFINKITQKACWTNTYTFTNIPSGQFDTILRSIHLLVQFWRLDTVRFQKYDFFQKLSRPTYLAYNWSILKVQFYARFKHNL